MNEGEERNCTRTVVRRMGDQWSAYLAGKVVEALLGYSSEGTWESRLESLDSVRKWADSLYLHEKSYGDRGG